MYDLESNILDISNNNFKYFMSLENITGVGLGYKRINGINTFEPCIHVLAEKRLTKNIYLKTI